MPARTAEADDETVGGAGDRAVSSADSPWLERRVYVEGSDGCETVVGAFVAKDRGASRDLLLGGLEDDPHSPR